LRDGNRYLSRADAARYRVLSVIDSRLLAESSCCAIMRLLSRGLVDWRERVLTGVDNAENEMKKSLGIFIL
jgi:hypothetical protein